jgi:hypothetical protein
MNFWDMLVGLHPVCPTCDSTDKDIYFLVSGLYSGLRICEDPWHEARIVKNEGQTRTKAASRQRRT